MNPTQLHKSYKEYKRIRILGPSILLLLIWLSACVSVSEKAPHMTKSTEHISPEVQTLLTLKPSQSTIRILIWSDKKTYNIGDEIVFFFRTSQDSYLNLFDVGSSGILRHIFPNQAHQNRLFKGGEIHRIPAENSRFGIQVAGPLGIEHIKAIATPEPWFTTLATENVNFLNISSLQTPGRESLQRALEKLKTLSWGEAQTKITIRESTHSPLGGTRQIKPKPPEKPIDITGTPGLKPRTRLSENKQTN